MKKMSKQCCLCDWQVPLVIFKREKEVARRLEFDGLYVTEQPPEEDIKGQWDRLVINTPYVHNRRVHQAHSMFTFKKGNILYTFALESLGYIKSCTTVSLYSYKHLILCFYRSFPSNYWDKFVKRKVR